MPCCSLQDYLAELVQVGHPVPVPVPVPVPPHSAVPYSYSLLGDEDSTSTATTSWTQVDMVSSKTKTKTNFAQAALLLQNSSFVYSRKVEYLHALVYSALNELVASTASAGNNETARKNKGGGGGGGDKDLEDFEAFDPHLHFLLLDDVLPVDPQGDHINLKLHKQPQDDSYDHHSNHHHHSNHSNHHHRDSHTRTSLGHNDTAYSHRLNLTSRTSIGTMSASRVERSFVDIVTGGGRTTAANGTAALLSDATVRATLEAIQSATFTQHRISNAHDVGSAGASLRLLHGACDIDHRGALLIPGSSIQTTTATEDKPHFSLQSQFAHAADSNQHHTTSNTLDPTTTQALDTHSEQDYGGAGDYHGDYDNDDDDNNNNNNDHMEGSAFHDNDESTSQLAQHHHEPVQDSTLSQRILRSRTIDKESTTNRVFTHDPWLMLDPHDPGSLKHCPIRVGMTFKLPSGVHGLPSDTVTGARTRPTVLKRVNRTDKRHQQQQQEQQLENTTRVDFISTATFNSILVYHQNYMQMKTASSHKDSSSPSHSIDSKTMHNQESVLFTIPKSRLIYGTEFAYIAEAGKKRVKEQEKLNRKARLERGIQATAPLVDIHQHVSDLYEDDYDDGGGDYDDDDDYGGGGFGIGYDNVEHPGDHPAVGTDAADVNISIHQFNTVFGSDDAGPVENAHDFLSFDELCRAHLKEFAKGAERYAVETQLSKRVSIWQDRLALILDEEENRPEFNIQSYGKKILNHVQANVLRANNTMETIDTKVCCLFFMM